MTAVPFDTYAFVQKLKSVGFTEEQAAVFATEQRRIVEEKLVTSDHFEQRMKELELSIANAKTEVIKWVAGMLIAQAALVATLVKLL